MTMLSRRNRLGTDPTLGASAPASRRNRLGTEPTLDASAPAWDA
jgi:hypothetical protein